MPENQNRLENFGKFLLFTKQREKLRKYLLQAGYKNIPYTQIAITFIFTILLTLSWYIIFLFRSGFLTSGWLFNVLMAPVLLALFEASILLITYFTLKIYVSAKIFNRIHNLEDNLPLFLREFSTNLKAGREFLDALEDTLTPELGKLNDDLNGLVIEIRSGKITEDVLNEYVARYDSYAVKETFGIILESYDEGGGLAELLDRIAYNLETINFLKKSAIASVYNYIIFMTIVSLIITPLLFALSYNVLVLIQNLLTRLVVQGSTYLPVYVSTLDINFGQFILFSRLAVAIVAGSAAAIIGIIRKGTLRGAPVIILIFITISILIYQLSFILLTKLFALLFTIA